MRRVLVAGRIHNAGIAKLEGRDDVEAEFLTAPTATEVAARLRSADALIVRTTPVTATAIVGAPRLRIVARHGVGFDNVAVEALTVRAMQYLRTAVAARLTRRFSNPMCLGSTRILTEGTAKHEQKT